MEKADRIYFDHQATCPLDERVFAAMREHLMGVPANPHSSEHSFGWQAAKTLLEAQTQVANLIGADADEIIFTSGATEANNLALRGREYQKRRKIIVSVIDHKCILEAARLLETEQGIEVATVAVDDEGTVQLDQLESMVDENTALISVIGVHNEIGTVQPLAHISRIARQAGAKLHLDLAQAPLAIDLSDAAELADTISLSAHKIYGPMGIGCLYVRRGERRNLKPLIVGGGQQEGLRSGTVPVPLAVGAGKAAQIVLDSESEREALRRLNLQLWKGLQELPFDVDLNGPSLDARHPANLNVSFRGYDSRDIIAGLQPYLAVSSGSACTSGTEEPSYVIRALGHSVDRAHSALRFSIGRSTTKADIRRAVSLVESVLGRMALAA